MTVTLEDASSHLHIDDNDAEALILLDDYVAAANEWVTGKVADTTPAPVRLATLLLIDHLWENQRKHQWEGQRGPATSPLADDTFVTASGFAFAIPNAVKELLDVYLAAAAGPMGSFPDAVAWPDAVERCW